MSVHIKRVYEAADKADGFRVLVDRLWPRGISKEAAAVDLWLKAVGPSTALRQWFNHEPEKWEEFKRRYFDELTANAEALRPLRDAIAKGPVTLVYSSRDEKHNQAVALKAFLSRSADG